MSLDALADRINAIARLTGTFTLRRGRPPREYFDKYRFEADPALLAEIAAGVLRCSPPAPRCSPGWSSAACRSPRRCRCAPASRRRSSARQAKAYGTAQLAEGATSSAGG